VGCIIQISFYPGGRNAVAVCGKPVAPVGYSFNTASLGTQFIHGFPDGCPGYAKLTADLSS
jgi:hypothetical protein